MRMNPGGSSLENLQDEVSEALPCAILKTENYIRCNECVKGGG